MTVSGLPAISMGLRSPQKRPAFGLLLTRILRLRPHRLSFPTAYVRLSTDFS